MGVDETHSARRRSSTVVQVSPTENYLRHEYRGWCFHESEPMCCGYMSSKWEDFLRKLLKTECCTSDNDPVTHSRKSANMYTGGNRSMDQKTTGLSTSLLKNDHLHGSTEMQRVDKAAAPDMKPTKDEIWEVHTDEKGSTYYWNSKTQQSSWKRPGGES